MRQMSNAKTAGLSFSLFSWLPLTCFVALLLTMLAVNVLPPDGHLAYAIVEWVLMVVGTLGAVTAVAIVYFLPRAAPQAPKGWSRYKWLAICGLGIWSIFWLIALLARPWID